MAEEFINAVQAEIDRKGVSAVQLRVVAVCAAVLVLDGYDIVCMGYALPALAETWHVPPASLTTALVMGNVGMLLGALVSGFLGDRVGRKPVFLANILCFGLFSVLSALCGAPGILAVMRFFTGMGLGGGVPLAVTLCSDHSPRLHQAKMVSIMTIGVYVGNVGGGMLTSQLIPAFGWQSAFWVGGVLPLLILPVVYKWLPESPHFRAAVLRSSAAGSLTRANPVLDLFRNGLTKVTVLLWIIIGCNFLVTYLILLWLPTILRQSGFSIAQSVFATTMFALAGGLTALLLGWPIARFGAERALTMTLLIGLAGTIWLASGTHTYGEYLLAIFLSGIGISGSQAGINALSGAAYPPLIRSTGSGWALGIGRLGNIGGPLLGGILLAYGLFPGSIFFCACIPIVITVIGMFLLGRARSRFGESLVQPTLTRSRT